MSWLSKDPLQIIVFKTYGNQHYLNLRGRALEDENIKLTKNSFWSILINTWKRFESDEIKNAKLSIQLPNGKIIETTTDKDGYFDVNLQVSDLPNKILKNNWLNIKVSYKNIKLKNKINNNNLFDGEVLIPSKNQEYGIISDIDDTILHTGVVSKFKWKLLVNSFFKAPSKRKALQGVSDFYKRLYNGNNGNNKNPIFYVSHSPWNMYRYLDFFLNENKFPKGAILLRTMKSVFSKNKHEKTAKQIEIEKILKTYSFNFILIGDAGEYDADIYMHIVKLFPNRIKAIFLRSVKNKKKMRRIKNLIKDYKDIPFFLIKDSKEAIEAAKKYNFIP